MSIEYSEITANDLAAIIESATDRSTVLLIDVRETDEYLGGHVPGAIHIPLGQIPERFEECRNLSGGPTYVICKAGGRSANACEFLAHQSIEAVNIAGGTMIWQMNGHEVVQGSNPL